MLPIAMIFTKLPFVGAALEFITKKKRLFVEYLMVGAVIVLGVMVVTLWLQKARVENALNEVNNKVGILEMANLTQSKKIDQLRDLRERDSKTLQGLSEGLNAISKRDAQVRNQLQSLEQSDEIIKTYLHTMVPDDIACLLERTCEGAM